MLGGGRDLIDLEPLDYDGNRKMDVDAQFETMGCHGGRFAGLNIRNPQPGFHYCYLNDTAQGRLEARQRGGAVVQAGDPEHSAWNEIVGAEGTPIDGAHTGYPGLILVKTPLERERQRRDEIAKTRDLYLKGSTTEEAFVAQGERQPGEAHYQRIARGPTRFAMGKHMTNVTASSSETSDVVDSWSAGIVRED